MSFRMKFTQEIGRFYEDEVKNKRKIDSVEENIRIYIKDLQDRLSEVMAVTDSLVIDSDPFDCIATIQFMGNELRYIRHNNEEIHVLKITEEEGEYPLDCIRGFSAEFLDQHLKATFGSVLSDLA